MSAINEHTKDKMATKPTTKEYETNWELIFGKKENVPDEGSYEEDKLDGNN